MQLWRERRPDFHGSRPARVLEANARSVEEVARERRKRLPARTDLPGRAVERITHYRMTQCRKMYADLMRPPRVEFDLNQRETVQAR